MFDCIERLTIIIHDVYLFGIFKTRLKNQHVTLNYAVL